MNERKRVPHSFHKPTGLHQTVTKGMSGVKDLQTTLHSHSTLTPLTHRCIEEREGVSGKTNR
ncbi:hypothetical protein E2C01_031816 [Portunus trituberculatus]|uniref:Uncharacterized protein n=1 Tax=Portunus trituberculatus TaxID=210409 RepID=A0A5B7EUF8_PORTR|nr:hypothetical protein [Portunus trituberculatus]